MTGRVAPGLDDAAPLVRRLTPEREFAFVGAIEAGAQFEQLFDARRRVAREDLDDCRIADSGARALRIYRMQARRVVLADRRRDAALRPAGRSAFTQRRLAENRHAGAAEFERGHQAGDAGADDDDVAAADLRHAAQSSGCRLNSSIRSTERRARCATSGAIVISYSIASSECRIFGSVLRFMCGQRLHGRTNSTLG